jgi:hypothetical protein
MSFDKVGSLQPHSVRARAFWKILAIVLSVMLFASTLVHMSMYFWPDMTYSPRLTEGRFYPIYKFDRPKYMNERERSLYQTLWWTSPVGGFALLAILFLVDPFDYKHRPRPLRPPRAY